MLIVHEWLNTVLTSDPTLQVLGIDRIYEHPAPAEAAHPLVTIQPLNPRDINGLGGVRIMSEGLWLVRAIDRAETYDAIRPIANRIDMLIHKASGTVNGGLVLACVREQPFSLAEEDDGIQYRHLGGIYKIVSQE